MLQLHHEKTKVLVTGNSCSGKSTFFTDYILQAPQGLKYVFDYEGEFAMRTGQKPVLTVTDLDEDRAVYPFDPSVLFPGDIALGFDFFCRYVFAMGQCASVEVDILFACDELQNVIGTDNIPQSFACIIETGRRYGIDTIFVAQAPNLVHNRIRNQISEVVTFTHLDVRALAYLESLGLSADDIRKLNVGEYFCWTQATGTHFRHPSA